MTSFNDLAKPGIDALRVYEPGRPIESVARELGLVDAPTKLASNENALGPSPDAIEAMRVAAASMHRYPDGGSCDLREAIAGELDVSPDNILPGNGSNELIELLGRVFLDESSSIVMSQFAFMIYSLVGQAFGARVLEVPMQNFCHDIEAMTDAVEPDTRLLFVANPNNPTGTVLPPDAIARSMERMPEHVIVCFDEAYIELAPEAHRPDVLQYVRDGRNVIVLRTFSKAYGLAGLRLGYGIAPRDCIELLNRVRQPFNVNAMAQVGAMAALADRDHVARTRRLVESELSFLAQEMDRLGLEIVPSVINLLLVKVGQGRRVFDALMRKGVIVRPMDGYGLPEYIRVTVGTRKENERFVAVLEDVMA